MTEKRVQLANDNRKILLVHRSSAIPIYGYGVAVRSSIWANTQYI